MVRQSRGQALEQSLYFQMLQPNQKNAIANQIFVVCVIKNALISFTFQQIIQFLGVLTITLLHANRANHNQNRQSHDRFHFIFSVFVAIRTKLKF